jgi:hypothetical protein
VQIAQGDKELPNLCCTLLLRFAGYTFPFQGVSYYVPNAQVPWQTAYDMCQVKGMQLASIWGTEMGYNLHAEVKARMPSTEFCYWIGGSDQAQEGVWTWADGTKWVNAQYTTIWAPDQPDNAAGGQNCLKVYRIAGYDGKWDDDLCTQSQYALCASACE